MCHLCRKVQAVEGMHSKVSKPIYIALSQLHKRVSPHLGEIYAWRLEHTERLKTLLERIQQNLPNKSIQALLEELEDEIMHLRKGLTDHPVRDVTLQHTEKFKRMSKEQKGNEQSISPHESTSMRMLTKIEHDIGRPLTEVELDQMVVRITAEERAQWVTMEEFSGSDLEPRDDRKKWIFRYVEEWMRKCDEDAESKPKTDNSENPSLVSFMGGVVMERPPLNVRKWYRPSRSDDEEAKRSDQCTTTDMITVPRTGSPMDRVFDKSVSKLPLRGQMIRKMSKLSITKEHKQTYLDRFKSLLHAKKTKRLSRAKNISKEKAIQQLEARKNHDKARYTIRRGRSYGPSTRASTRPVSPTMSSQGRSSFSTVNDSLELSDDEVQQCVEEAHANTDSGYGDSSTATSDSSESVLDVKRILGPYIMARKDIEYSESEDDFRPSTPRPVRRRPPSIIVPYNEKVQEETFAPNTTCE